MCARVRPTVYLEWEAVAAERMRCVSKERVTKKSALDMVKRDLILNNKATLATLIKMLDGPRSPNCLMFRPVRTRCSDCKDVTPPTKKAKSQNLDLSSEDESKSPLDLSAQLASQAK